MTVVGKGVGWSLLLLLFDPPLRKMSTSSSELVDLDSEKLKNEEVRDAVRRNNRRARRLSERE